MTDKGPIPRLVDWSAYCNILRARSKIPLSRHAMEAHMDERTINRLARGEIDSPRFDQGVMLLDVGADHLTPKDWQRVLIRQARNP